MAAVKFYVTAAFFIYIYLLCKHPSKHPMVSIRRSTYADFGDDHPGISAITTHLS